LTGTFDNLCRLDCFDVSDTLHIPYLERAIVLDPSRLPYNGRSAGNFVRLRSIKDESRARCILCSQNGYLDKILYDKFARYFDSLYVSD